MKWGVCFYVNTHAKIRGRTVEIMGFLLKCYVQMREWIGILLLQMNTCKNGHKLSYDYGLFFARVSVSESSFMGKNCVHINRHTHIQKRICFLRV